VNQFCLGRAGDGLPSRSLRRLLLTAASKTPAQCTLYKKVGVYRRFRTVRRRFRGVHSGGWTFIVASRGVVRIPEGRAA